VDFRRQAEGQQTVVRIEYDPGRTAHIALLEHDETGEQSYILAPEGLRFGAKVQSWPNGLQQQKQGEAKEGLTPISTDPASAQHVTNPADRPADAHLLNAHTTNSGASSSADATDAEGQPASLATSLLRTSMLQLGNQLPLHLIPPGTTIHCISTRPGGKASMCRSAGSSAKVVALTSAGSKGSQYAQIQLTSGEVRKLHHNCTAVVGSVSNREHQNEVMGKAGRMRWLGRKPRNRGASMNA
jgi:ribosomal protein L2